jgi:hypothetical protein
MSRRWRRATRPPARSSATSGEVVTGLWDASRTGVDAPARARRASHDHPDRRRLPDPPLAARPRAYMVVPGASSGPVLQTHAVLPLYGADRLRLGGGDDARGALCAGRSSLCADLWLLVEAVKSDAAVAPFARATELNEAAFLAAFRAPPRRRAQGSRGRVSGAALPTRGRRQPLRRRAARGRPPMHACHTAYAPTSPPCRLRLPARRRNLRLRGRPSTCVPGDELAPRLHARVDEAIEAGTQASANGVLSAVFEVMCKAQRPPANAARAQSLVDQRRDTPIEASR